MKGTPLVICALLGATQAIQANKEYVYDDATQYDDSNIKDFIEEKDKSEVKQILAQQKLATKPVPAAPVAKPIPATKP